MFDQIEFRSLSRLLLVLPLFLLLGCNEKEYINIKDKNLTKSPLPCLGLAPLNPAWANRELSSLYHFNKSCEYKIAIETKGGIHCNSTFNVPQKVNSNFPSAYLRLELKRGMESPFSYYVDLTSAPTASDIDRAFEAMGEHLQLPKK